MIHIRRGQPSMNNDAITTSHTCIWNNVIRLGARGDSTKDRRPTHIQASKLLMPSGAQSQQVPGRRWKLSVNFQFFIQCYNV